MFLKSVLVQTCLRLLASLNLYWDSNLLPAVSAGRVSAKLMDEIVAVEWLLNRFVMNHSDESSKLLRMPMPMALELLMALGVISKAINLARTSCFSWMSWLYLLTVVRNVGKQIMGRPKLFLSPGYHLFICLFNLYSCPFQINSSRQRTTIGMQPPTRKQLWPSIEARVPLKKKCPYETKNKIIPLKEEPSMPYLGQPSD